MTPITMVAWMGLIQSWSKLRLSKTAYRREANSWCRKTCVFHAKRNARIGHSSRNIGGEMINCAKGFVAWWTESKKSQENIKDRFKNEMIALFSMLDTDPEIRKAFLRLSQLQEPRSLKKSIQLPLTGHDALQNIFGETDEQSITKTTSDETSPTLLSIYWTSTEAPKISL